MSEILGVFMKIKCLSIFLLASYLCACTPTIQVSAIQEIDSTATKLKTQSRSLHLLPKNATALCRDNYYTTAQDHTACLGYGGVDTYILRYYAK